MKIGVLGTKHVGPALAKAFITLGHDVKLGGRDPRNENAMAWAKDNGPKASVGTLSEAAAFGELIVLATLGTANEAVIAQAGPKSFSGKIVIDATNPVEMKDGKLVLASARHDSGGEQVQRLLPDAQVVKAFNTVNSRHMFRPQLPGGPPDMFIAGNDEAAKKKVTAILSDFGWPVVDLGGIEASRYLEAMCVAYCLYAFKTGNWDLGFKLLRK